ncbi:MAG: membrane dipeptidase [Myxococcales bacterium]|nr:membrane dipeptidase [Myxococcales bacterium]
MAVAATPNHVRDPGDWAAELGISREAVELYQGCDVLDLHVDSFIWTRTLGYDLRKRHGSGIFNGRFYSQVDFPRALEAGLTGALWSITTNPYRGAGSRARTFARNAARLRSIFESEDERFAIVSDAAGYRAARDAGKHGAFLVVQGGNAADVDDAAIDALIDAGVIAVTLVHLSTSRLGGTSSPIRGGEVGLRDFGRHYVERLNAARVFVDLAHISERGFHEALEVHDSSQPLLVSHTGMSGVHPLWRNIDDRQLRAVADTGGVAGVIFHSGYLGDPYWTGGKAATIVDHLEHIVRKVGAEHAALGSDWDGMIITPRDMPTCLELPRLVQLMLERGFAHDDIRKVMGGSFLRALEALRG